MPTPDETLAAMGVTTLRHSVISDVPAATWEKAMVTGNGIQGAMAMGRVPDETIVLNHAGLFLPLSAPFPTVSQARILPEVRRMLAEGKFEAAADRVFALGKEEGKDGRTWTDPFVPACSLQVGVPQRGAPQSYLRSTDFSTGVTGTRWEDETGLHVRRLFVSRPDNVVVLSLTGTHGVDCDLNFILHDPKVNGAAPPPGPDAVKDATAEAEAGEGGGWLTFRVSYTHRWPGSLQGCEVAARVIAPGGTTTAANGKLTVRGAKDVLVLVRTTLSRDIGQSQLPEIRTALGKLDGYDKLLARHTAVHGEIMKRCQLDLGGSEADHRLTAPALFAKSRVGALNAALLEKEFDACRYLALSSSGPEYPPNLQGIWGATWKPAWSGDYTQNGNLQTVVSGNLIANMPEAMEGFFHYLESQLPDYRDNARQLFGTRGIHVPSRTSTHGLLDQFLTACPVTFWTAGAAWNAQFFYDYWLTTGDKKFLLEHALPWMKEAAAFYEDFLYAGPDGKWVFNPSFSPENNGKARGWALAALNSTIDIAAARELFSNLVTVCGQLGIELDNVAKWKGILVRMPDYKINSDGAVAEWNTPLLKDCYSHRHASHIYGLYAGLPADIAANPALQAAFKVAIEKRMEWRRANNGADMAFGLCQLGWPAASLHDGKTAYETVDWLANNFWFAESLVTSHNIRSIFNTDIAGGLPRLILTMLVQSEPGRLELLPALPREWPTGRVTGILCRGQIEVRELTWYPDEIRVTLRSAVAQQVVLRHDGLRGMKVIRGSASVTAPQADGSRLVSLPAGRDVTLLLAPLAGLHAAETRPVKPQAIVTINTDAPSVAYSRMIFGGFLEHFDRQIYGGVFEPGSPLSDKDGFRTDVVAALKELKVPVVRWPGGCFVSGYHWESGVGKGRKPTDDMAWGVREPNTFGTDEFVKLSKLVGWQPYICNNAGNGTVEEMRNWVEYCNGNTGTFAQLRKDNGFPAPQNVKLWSVGNENWGRHEIGYKPIEQWAPLVLEAAKAMKAADPNIQLSAAALPSKEWTLPLLKMAGPYLDYISIHSYWLPLWQKNDMPDYLTCIMQSEAPEKSIANFIGVLEESGYRGRIKIAYDEWNLRSWHHPGFPRKTVQNYSDPKVMELVAARAKSDVAMQYTMADALFSASFFNACLRHAEDVGMANIAPIVNTRGPLFVHPKGIVRRTHFHAMAMYANELEPRVGKLDIQADKLIHGKQSVSVADAIATVDDSGKHWAIALVNRHPEQELACTVKMKDRLLDGKYAATVLAGDSPEAFNDIERPDRVAPQKTTLTFTKGVANLPPHSLTMVKVPLKETERKPAIP